MTDENANGIDDEVEDRRQHIKRSEDPAAAKDVEGDVSFPALDEQQQAQTAQTRRRKRRKS